MPTDSVYEDSLDLFDELEDLMSDEYPEVAETVGTARGQLEEAHAGMEGEGEEGEEELPPDLEGEGDFDTAEGGEEDFPADLEGEFGDEEIEEEDEELPA